MFSQDLVPSITKNVISCSFILRQKPIVALQIKIFIKVFQYILKLLENFII